jgi:hypothetical protein
MSNSSLTWSAIFSMNLLTLLLPPSGICNFIVTSFTYYKYVAILFKPKEKTFVDGVPRSDSNFEEVGVKRVSNSFETLMRTDFYSMTELALSALSSVFIAQVRGRT